MAISLVTGTSRLIGDGVSYDDGPIAGSSALLRVAPPEEYAKGNAWFMLDIRDGAGVTSLAVETRSLCDYWRESPNFVRWLSDTTLAVGTNPWETTDVRILDLTKAEEGIFDREPNRSDFGPKKDEFAARELVVTTPDGGQFWTYATNGAEATPEFYAVSPDGQTVGQVSLPGRLMLQIDERHWLVSAPGSGGNQLHGTEIIDLANPSNPATVLDVELKTPGP